MLNSNEIRATAHSHHPDVETATETYASRFSGPAGEYFLEVQRELIGRAVDDVPDGAKALDVGGGHGQNVDLLLDKKLDVTVLGSEEAALQRLHQYTESAQLVVGELLAMPFAEQTFAVVVAIRLMAHVDDWQVLIRECCRVASDRIIIDYPRKSSVNAFMAPLFRVKRRVERGTTRYYDLFSDEEVEETIREAGFVVTRQENQYFLPMALHRALGGARWLRGVETLARKLGLTARFGSPAILCAKRQNPSELDEAAPTS